MYFEYLALFTKHLQNRLTPEMKIFTTVICFALFVSNKALGQINYYSTNLNETRVCSIKRSESKTQKGYRGKTYSSRDLYFLISDTAKLIIILNAVEDTTLNLYVSKMILEVNGSISYACSFQTEQGMRTATINSDSNKRKIVTRGLFEENGIINFYY